MAKFVDRPLPAPPGQSVPSEYRNQPLPPTPHVVTGMPRSGRRPSVDIYLGDTPTHQPSRRSPPAASSPHSSPRNSQEKPIVPFVYKPYKPPEDGSVGGMKKPQLKSTGGRRGPLPAPPPDDGPPMVMAPRPPSGPPHGVRMGRRPSLPTLPMPPQTETGFNPRDTFPPRGTKAPLSPIPDHDQTDSIPGKGAGLKQSVPPPRPHLRHTTPTGNAEGTATGYLSPTVQQRHDKSRQSAAHEHPTTPDSTRGTSSHGNPTRNSADTGYLSPKSQQNYDKRHSPLEYAIPPKHHMTPDSTRPVTPPPDYPMNNHGPVNQNRRPSIEDLSEDLRNALAQRTKDLNKSLSTPSFQHSENASVKISDQNPNISNEGKYHSTELSKQEPRNNRTQNLFDLNDEDYARMDKPQNQKRISPAAIEEPEDDNYVPVYAYNGPPIGVGPRGSHSIRSRRDSILPPGLEPEPETPDVQPYKRHPCPFIAVSNEPSPPRPSKSMHVPPTGIYTTYAPPCDYDTEFEKRFIFETSGYWPEVTPFEYSVKTYPSQAGSNNRFTAIYT